MPSATERSLELFLVERMQVDDLDQIRRIEKESFPTPWPRDSYRREIMQNDRAQYLVLRRAGVPRAAPPATFRLAVCVFPCGASAPGAPLRTILSGSPVCG